ncbi:MAG TPA: hypothetical protein PJ982_05525 [Lacipirellulaceae bacterium]|nr:hypothetical protein [Lacipirellulaceae bacterium]
MATIIDIAAAVVAELNGHAFSQPVSAVRHYAPQFDLAAMTTLHVTVVPKGLSSTSLDRTRDTFEYQIDLAVQQKVDQANPPLDALMTLVEEIADHFRAGALASFPGARCTEVKNEPVYAPEHLIELGQFTSILTLTFKVFR